jgi:hypothetical protein
MAKKTIAGTKQEWNQAGPSKPSRRSSAEDDLSEGLREVLQPTVATLKRLAGYRLDPALARRMQELGERKEFLGKREHEELLRLVAFWRQRVLDKLQAKLALQRLRRIVPEILKES